MIHLLPDAGEFLERAASYTMKQLNLEIVCPIEQAVESEGKMLRLRAGFVMRSRQGRRYYFVAKRNMHFTKDKPEVSIDTEILKNSIERNCHTLLYIEAKSEETTGDYIYSTDPQKVFSDPRTWENSFNGKLMTNFDVRWLVNMIPTRMRGPVEIRIEEQSEREKNSLVKWIR